MSSPNYFAHGVVPVILAGGSSTRFGSDKLFVEINGVPLIKNTAVRLEEIFGREPIIVGSPMNSSRLAKIFDKDKLVIDKYCCGPIAGVISVLKLYSRVFVIGGDMPCIQKELVEKILLEAEKGYSIVATGWRNGWLEPLHAYYSSSALPYVNQFYLRGIKSLSRIIHLVPHTKIILVDDLPLITKLSFYNINTRDDLACYLEGLRKGAGDPCLNCVGWIIKKYGLS